MNIDKLSDRLAFELISKDPQDADRRKAKSLGSEMMDVDREFKKRNMQEHIRYTLAAVEEVGMNLRRLTETFSADDPDDYDFLVEDVKAALKGASEHAKHLQDFHSLLDQHIKAADKLIKGF